MDKYVLYRNLENLIKTNYKNRSHFIYLCVSLENNAYCTFHDTVGSGKGTRVFDITYLYCVYCRVVWWTAGLLSDTENHS